jgi:transposase-like protein
MLKNYMNYTDFERRAAVTDVITRQKSMQQALQEYGVPRKTIDNIRNTVRPALSQHINAAAAEPVMATNKQLSEIPHNIVRDTVAAIEFPPPGKAPFMPQA